MLSTCIMNTLNTMVAVSLLTAGIPLFGCEQKPDRNATPTRQPGGGVTNVQPRSYAEPSTVERLSRARCEHERYCDNVGGGKKYASWDICVSSYRSSIGNELNSYECPGGLNASAVQQCLTAISKEECGVHPIDTIARVEQCRKGAMCIDK